MRSGCVNKKSRPGVERSQGAEQVNHAGVNLKVGENRELYIYLNLNNCATMSKNKIYHDEAAIRDNLLKIHVKRICKGKIRILVKLNSSSMKLIDSLPVD